MPSRRRAAYGKRMGLASGLTASITLKVEEGDTALALGMLGILLLVDAVRGGWQPAEEKEVTPDRAALLWIIAGLVLNVLLITWAGFTIASVILFVCVARGFGSKAIVRDALIGAAFALVAYIGFAKTLGINIGSGLVENAIERVIGSEGG